MMSRKQIEKVLLIQPPLTTHTDFATEPKGVHPPLGLAYIAALLEDDFQVKIIDTVAEGFHVEEKIGSNIIRYGLKFEEIKERILHFGPHLVGVSNLFTSGFRDAFHVCKLAKEIDKNIITVMGGPHPTAVPQEILKSDEVDFVVLGEADHSFKEFVIGVNKGDYSKVDGIASKCNGSIKIIPKARYIDNLDGLPFPARHLLPMKKYFEIGEAFIVNKETPFTPITTSRGCLANCTFCPTHINWGSGWRARSAENVLDEIEHLVTHYGIKELHFVDDNLTLDKNRAKRIFQGMIDRRFNLAWTCPTGIALWAIDDHLLALMKESGCYKLYVAVEHGDEDMLHKIIRKPLDLGKTKPLVRAMKKIGIEVETYFVVGMPGETRESLMKSFHFARELDADATHFFFANPIPGTYLWKLCEENNYFVRDFSYDMVRMGKANIETPELSAKELERLVAKEQLVYRILSLIKHPIRMGKKYLSYLKKDKRIILNFLAKNIKEAMRFT